MEDFLLDMTWMSLAFIQSNPVFLSFEKKNGDSEITYMLHGQTRRALLACAEITAITIRETMKELDMGKQMAFVDVLSYGVKQILKNY